MKVEEILRSLERPDPKERVKFDILKKFQDINAGPGDLLPPRWLDLIYIPRLSREEEKVYPRAMDELTRAGVLETVDDNYNLTGTGFALLPGKKA
jgi:hypothetical protein